MCPESTNHETRCPDCGGSGAVEARFPVSEGYPECPTCGGTGDDGPSLTPVTPAPTDEARIEAVREAEEAIYQRLNEADLLRPCGPMVRHMLARSAVEAAAPFLSAPAPGKVEVNPYRVTIDRADLIELLYGASPDSSAGRKARTRLRAALGEELMAFESELDEEAPDA